MTKTGMSNNDYVQNVSKILAHVQVGYVQVGYVQVKFVTFWKKFHKCLFTNRTDGRTKKN